MSEEIKKLKDSFIDKIYEFTGDEHNRGFIIAYINEDGIPVIESKTSSNVSELALVKYLEMFLATVDVEPQNIGEGGGTEEEGE